MAMAVVEEAMVRVINTVMGQDGELEIEQQVPSWKPIH